MITGALQWMLFAAFGFSLASCALSLLAVRQSRSKQATSPASESWRESLAQLSAEMSDLKLSYDSLLTSHERLRSRIKMREVRAGKDDESSGPIDAATLKAQLRERAGLMPGRPVKPQ